MKHFQIPELQDKLRHALALAADKSTTPHEREAARRAADRIRAKLKAREGVEGSAPFPKSPYENVKGATYANGCSVPNFTYYEYFNGKMYAASGNSFQEFQEAIERMHRRRAAENPGYNAAYRKAY